MTLTILPRSAAGLNPVVKNTNRITKRPLLRQEIPLVVVHYTGNKRKYAGLDEAEVAKTIRSIDRWRANEYNYVIDQDGRIWEFAGEYQAAHARGFNDRSYGILFLNGVGEPANWPQLGAFKFLMDCLLWTKRITPGAWVVGHGEIANTACPGDVRQAMEGLRTLTTPTPA